MDPRQNPDLYSGYVEAVRAIESGHGDLSAKVLSEYVAHLNAWATFSTFAAWILGAILFALLVGVFVYRGTMTSNACELVVVAMVLVAVFFGIAVVSAVEYRIAAAAPLYTLTASLGRSFR